MVEKLDKVLVGEIRKYILSREEITQKDIWVGDKNYSLIGLLVEVENETPVGIKFAQMYEKQQKRETE